MVADELREICLPGLTGTMKLAIGEYIVMDTWWIMMKIMIKITMAMIMMESIIDGYITNIMMDTWWRSRWWNMTPKMCASRGSNMQKLLMSHLMGFNGTQSGLEEIYQHQVFVQ